MKFSLVKDASKFAWKHLYKNTDSWFMLCLKVVLMVFAVMIGIIAIVLAAIIFSAIAVSFFMSKTNMLPETIAKYFWLTISIFLVPIALVMLARMINIAFISTANAIDVAEGKPMRQFKNQMTGFTMFIVLTLMTLAIMFGLVLLIIPGIIFAVRFSFAPYIVIDERCGAMQAMSKSWSLTENNFAEIFPVVTWAWLITVIPVINILNYFFPFTHLVMSFAYVSLKERS